MGQCKTAPLWGGFCYPHSTRHINLHRVQYRYMKHTFFISLATGAAVVSALLFSVPAQASSLSPVQVQAILGLMNSFGADPSTVAQVQASLGGTSAAAGQTGSSCVTLSNNLKLGSLDSSTNGDVSKLQHFLSGSVTGRFGPVTLQLVKDWQSAHGIVSGGTPDTTGYGSVGARTRAAMACGSSISPTPSSATIPATNFGMTQTYSTHEPTPQFTSPAPQPTPATSASGSTGAASAVIDKINASGLTPAQTTVTGRAQGINYITFSLLKNGSEVYNSGLVSVINGVWSVTVPQSAGLSGTYNINVFDGSSTRVLSRGSMTVTVNPGQ